MHNVCYTGLHPTLSSICYCNYIITVEGNFMKLMFDFLPIVLFFVAYKIKGIYVATIVAIVITALQVLYGALTKKKIDKMQLTTLLIIVLFGGATIFLQDEIYIKWKVTIVNWLFAIGFFISHFAFKQNAIEMLMSKSLSLPKEIYTKLNMSWALFFAFIGGLNLYIAYNFDTNTWVNFKLFGVIGLSIIFILGQSIVLAKYTDKR